MPFPSSHGLSGGDCSSEDADEHVRVTAALRESEALFRTLFNSIDQGFCIIEVLFDEAERPVDYVFLEINRSFERHTGLENAVGKRMRAMRPDHEEHWFQIYGRIALTGEPQHFENRAAALDRWYDVDAFRVGAPAQHRVAILFDDITARKRAEQSLRDSEARLRTLFETMNEGFVIGELVRNPTDGEACDFRYLEAAPSFFVVTGLTPEAVIGRTAVELFGHLEDIWRNAFQTVGRGVPIRTEGYFAALDKWFQASFTPLGDNRAAIIFSDVTERHRRERELQEARARADAANVSKSKFLAAASHDLRQPIQSLLLFSEVLAAKLAGHPANGVVAKMSAALGTFKDLLDSLLDLSKLDAGLVVPKVAPHAMTALIQGLADAYQPRMAAKGLKFKRRGGEHWAMVDSTLLRRILSNLLDNALKYTRRGGVLLAYRRTGDKVRIDVVDTGVGIPVEHLSEIFDEFVQVGEAGREQKQGMGLGLATVKRLALLLDYRISVHSRPGVGSRFTLTVPAIEAPAEDAGIIDSLDHVARSYRVLVVDDDPTIVEGMRALLEMVGYDVATATRAEEAFAVLHGDAPPDAVVADYRLGGAITGIDLIEEARRRIGRRLPAVVITGDTGIRSCPELAILHKPVAPDLLRQTLAEMCR